MAESKTWNWVKNNIAAIVVPLISGIIALGISYGASIQEETVLLNRISNLETQVSALALTNQGLEDDIDLLRERLRDGDRAVRDLLIQEGRDLERTLIRIDARLDNIARRLAVVDGIGAPIPSAPSTAMPTYDWMVPDFVPDGELE